MNASNAVAKRQLTWSVFLWVWVGCLDSEVPPFEDDPVEATVAALGTQIAGCASGGFDTRTLTLNVTDEPLVLSVKGGKIQANGYICSGMVGNAMQQLTPNEVYKIVIIGDANPNKVILDLLPASFGMRIFSSMGGVLVDFATVSGGNDTVGIRGANTADTFKFGTSTTTSDIYAELSRDKIADLRIRPGASLTLIASSGGGADQLSASAVSGDMTSFGGSGITVGSLTNPISLYGGAADDILTGGSGADFLSGGDGNDTLKAGAFPDGNDVYSGDNGSDTVDYSARTDAVSVDIGSVNVARVANADLAKLDYAQLAGKTLVYALDGGSNVTVTFTTPQTPADVVSQINTVAGATVASLFGKNQLMLMTTTHTTTSSVKVDASSTAIAAGILDMASGTTATVPGTAFPLDNDDGQSGETDDVRTGTESITGGSGDDVLVGDAAKNTIKGGSGNDVIAGGSSTCAPELTAASGDVLQGESGNDTFYVPVPNCWAVLNGGSGNNAVDFSARSAQLTLSNNGIANDGITDERVNIAIDVLKLVGGMANDTLLGGSMNDTLVGGPGADVLNGGSGTDDIADYSATTANTNISVCFTSTIDMCGAGNDGAAEGDQVYLIEHVIGGSGGDTMTVLNNADVNVTFEGRAGTDSLTGGVGNDTLRGDADNDSLTGGDGDDTINGGAGVDVIDGGEGQGDVCAFDVADSPAAINCEG